MKRNKHNENIRKAAPLNEVIEIDHPIHGIVNATVTGYKLEKPYKGDSGMVFSDNIDIVEMTHNGDDVGLEWHYIVGKDGKLLTKQ